MTVRASRQNGIGRHARMTTEVTRDDAQQAVDLLNRVDLTGLTDNDRAVTTQAASLLSKLDSELAPQRVGRLAVMSDASYRVDDKENPDLRGLALLIDNDASAKKLIDTLGYKMHNVSSGLSFYRVQSLDDVDGERAATLLASTVRALLSDGDVAEALRDRGVGTRHLNVGLYYTVEDSADGGEPTKQWYLYVRAHDATGSVRLAEDVNAGVVTSMIDFAGASSKLRRSGAFLRNAVAAAVASKLELNLGTRAVSREKVPWESDGQQLAVATASVDNVWNTAIETSKTAVAFYYYATAAPLNVGGVVYGHTAARGMTLLRSDRADGRLMPSQLNGAANLAFPRGWPLKNHVRTVSVNVTDVTDADRTAIDNGTIQWVGIDGQEQYAYHPKVRSNMYAAAAEREQAGVFKALGWPGTRRSRLYLAALTLGSYSIDADMSMRDMLTVTRAFPPTSPSDAYDANKVAVDWHEFMPLYVKHRRSLGPQFSLATLSEPQPGERIVALRVLLDQLTALDTA